jgi:hypothetical protein
VEEIIKLDKKEWMVINGVLVKSVEFSPHALGNVKSSKDSLINIINNKYGQSTPDKIDSDDLGDYYSGTIECYLGEVEVDFVVIVKRSHMYVDRVEVVL